MNQNPLPERELEELYRESTDEIHYGRLVEMAHGIGVGTEIDPAKPRPVDRYIVLYAEVEELLTDLRERHERNYGTEPSEIDWESVGRMDALVEVLRYASLRAPDRREA